MSGNLLLNLQKYNNYIWNNANNQLSLHNVNLTFVEPEAEVVAFAQSQ